MKKFYVMAIFIFIIYTSNPSLAITVGGIIKTDTTWNLINSPYTLTSEVQVAEGVTLTIEPGVVIDTYDYDGGVGTYGKISLWGNLKAIGSEASNIHFNGVHVTSGDYAENASLTLQYVQFNGGNLGSNGHYKTLILRDSTFWDVTTVSCGDTREDCFIERNIFMRLNEISVSTQSSISQKVYIRNNSFYDQIFKARAIFLWSLSNKIIIEYNSFWSTDRIAITMNNIGSGNEIIASNNFWNTTDPNVIDSMIYDKDDSLELMGYVKYKPFLTESHVNTPIIDLPVANAGIDQTVYEGEKVILDGSSSSDIEGGSASYQWTQEGGFSVILSDSTTINPTFVAPSIDEIQFIYRKLTFQLRVIDNENNKLQNSDSLSVIIEDNGIKGFPSDVTTFKTSTNKNVGVKIGGGGLVELNFIDPSTIIDSENQSEDLIYGLIDMKIKTSEAGTARITVYLQDSAPQEYNWYIYSYINGWGDYNHSPVFNNDRDQINFSLTDGLEYDEDNLTNGIIRHISGLRHIPSQPSDPIPNEDGDDGPNKNGDKSKNGCFIATITIRCLGS